MSIMTDKIVSRPIYEDRILGWMDKPVIKVLTGLRRAGKSSILARCIARLRQERGEGVPIVHVNMELLENEKFRDIELLNAEVKRVAAEAGGKVFVFLDEVQEIPRWERLVSSLLAEGVADLTVTGSNARLLAGELATLLAGRYVDFPVYPLVFREYCRFGNLEPGRPAFWSYLQSGGMPGLVALSADEGGRRQYLEALLDSIVLRDVVTRHNLRDVALLRKILLFVADNVGNPVSARAISAFLKSQSRAASVESIYNYLEHLEEAFVVYPAPVFDLRGKRLLETGGKMYFADAGLRHALLGYRAADVGQYLENVVYVELRQRGWQVSVGRQGDWEVDFVAERAGERMFVQVAYLVPNAETLERELRPLRAIRDNFPKFLVTMDQIPASTLEGIEWMPVEEFLIGPEAGGLN
jgi:predicted AAA+ superfamily ATPase